MSQSQLSKKTRTYSITATTTPQELCKSNFLRKGIQVRVLSTDTVYILSNQIQPYTEGIPVTSSQPYTNRETIAPLWVVTSSSTAVVYIQDSTD
jgi:hypothetical protein